MGSSHSTFLLDRASGAYSRIDKKNPFQNGATGVALEWQVGLLRRRTDLLALIADDDSLWVRAGGQEFDLLDPEVRVYRRNGIPFVRRLEVSSSGNVWGKQFYWANVLDDDDLPGFIAEITQDRVELLRTLVRYRAFGQGRDLRLPDVQRALEEELADLVSSDGTASRNAARE